MSHKPNIVFITTHDTGRHFGCYGRDTVQSPAIDHLAEEGVRFTNCYCVASKCSPSRAAMMTGRWPQANGVYGLTHAPHWWEYNDGEKHLAAVLREVGYSTHLFHFQHETEEPKSLGFDRLHGVHTWPEDEMPDPYMFTPAPEVARDFAEFCDDATSGHRPFYAQIGFFETHRPFDFGGNEGDEELGVELPSNYQENAGHRRFFRMLQGAIRQVDEAVDVIIQALRDSGLHEDTLVIFTTDHGVSYKRAKGTLYDPGLEVALIMFWPGGGVRGGRTCGGLMSNIDVFPTVLELVGVEVPDNVQGVSFAPVVRGGSERERQYVFGELQEQMFSRCVRDDRYKLIRNFRGSLVTPAPVNGGGPPYPARPVIEMYDLRADPIESENVAEHPTYAEERDRLDAVLLRHLREVNDHILDQPPATPYNDRARAHCRRAMTRLGLQQREGR